VEEKPVVIVFLSPKVKYAGISTTNRPTEKPRFPVRLLVQVEKKPSLLHRSRIDIIANILHAAEGGAKKTHIMYKCNLSFRQLHIYLNYLTERKLLKSIPAKTGERNDSNTYEITEKGKAFIQAYRNIRALLSG
jgi:predicted transcriptional regulator